MSCLIRIAAAVAVTLTMMTTAQATVTPGRADVSVTELRDMSQTQLNAQYLGRHAGPMPDGDSHGTAVFFPGSIINMPTQMIAAMVWQGKVFDTSDGVLVNKVFGFDAIKAQVFYGPSLFDGEQSVIIDYHDTSILFGRVRDEIRQVGPNLYLGRAYIRGIFMDFMAVNFILDFNNN